MNQVILRGKLTSEPRMSIRGDVHWDLTTEVDGEKLSVPVFWPGETAPAAEKDQEWSVIGKVRRRFTRATGGVTSITEVVADEALNLDDKVRGLDAYGTVIDL